VRLSVRRVAVLVTALGGAAGAGAAQQRDPAVVVPLRPATEAEARDSGLSDALARRPWIPPLASLIVPGSGQLIERKDRGLIYLAAEVWIIARAAALTRAGRRDRRAFQDLAFNVARARFTTQRRDGGFEYYESMTHYAESGRFDLDSGAALVPETDTATFNGAMWLLARRTYFVYPDSAPSGAEYDAALAFYQSRAVGPDFRWSWRDARLEQDVFRSRIRSSDDAFRSATNYLGALVLNHLGSAVDALISVRLGRGGAERVPRLMPGPHEGEFRLLWNARF
jgi:hypothetical protein